MWLLKVHEPNLYLRSLSKYHLLKDILVVGCYQAQSKEIHFMKKKNINFQLRK